MSRAVYTSELVEGTARAVLAGVPGAALNHIVLRDVRSPWEEKIRLQSSRNKTDITFFIWKSPEFLIARVHRLALYVLDYFDPAFTYDRNGVSALQATPGIRRTHHHIWSIYVDSRIEKMGLENFYDRPLRRSLFIDSQKTWPWTVSSRFFERLWEKERFTHPEIIDYARDPGKLTGDAEPAQADAFELEISRYAVGRTLKEHVEKIPSRQLRELAHTLLAFVSSRCRETIVEMSYYGVRFMSQGELFAEMVTTKNDVLLFTLFDCRNAESKNYTIGTDTQGLEQIQRAIKDAYDTISQSHSTDLKESFSVPI
jgi:hypothetical protein